MTDFLSGILIQCSLIIRSIFQQIALFVLFLLFFAASPAFAAPSLSLNVELVRADETGTLYHYRMTVNATDLTRTRFFFHRRPRPHQYLSDAKGLSWQFGDYQPFQL